MLKQNNIFILLTLFSLSIYAQTNSVKFEKLPNADLKNAITIKDSIVGPINVSIGSGDIVDFYYNDEILESNSAWFKIEIPQDTLLTFDIVPIDSLDDYDFTIFKCPQSDCKKYVKSNKSISNRFCFSYCTSKSGVTGLSEYTQTSLVDVGPGPAYASALPVKAGETYYLMVNFSQTYIQKKKIPAGFMIYFYNYYPQKKPIILKNLFFETNKSVLLKESFSELDSLANQMKKNQMKIEVRGHTDNVGDEEKNQILSEERAKAVVDYLISKNISKNRLFYKGFGSSRPIANNSKAEGRKKNRRVEFSIVMR